MSNEWEQVGIVEILRLRIYPLDPMGEPTPLRTYVAVEPGSYPVLRKADAYRWMMTGQINERNEKIGDGLFVMHGGDNPTGPEVRFSSQVYGVEQFAEFLADPICQSGPLVFHIFATPAPAERWVNNPCANGCDCGDCYSRCPDEGPCHCALAVPEEQPQP
jgi:hypothetical protein